MKPYPEINSMVSKMTDERRSANRIESAQDKADSYCEKVLPCFDKIRYHCDKLELMVDDDLWTLTKYRELLFTR